MALYIRQLDADDLDRCVAVETSAFPPTEAASREKIEYRLTMSPKTCFGLFLRDGAGSATRAPQHIPILSECVSSDDVLVGHLISTLSTSRPVRDKDMSIPPNWKADLEADHDVGHQRNGKTIALHSLAISSDYQRSGFGKALLSAYLEEMKKAGRAERISILTYDRLLPYYQNLGFEHYGRSECQYAGVDWHDLSYVF